MTVVARPNIERMSGYVPGEQPGPGERVVKLNTNENPFPPSPRVMQAIRGDRAGVAPPLPQPHRRRASATAAAQLHGVTPDMIIAGNGSDDILTIAMRTFVAPGEVDRLARPDLLALPRAGRDRRGAQCRRRPVGARLARCPTDALLATTAAAIFFANPNAPTGTFVPPDEGARSWPRRIRRAWCWSTRPTSTSPTTTACRCVRDCPNVVVTRTLSKAYTLAGLRFGYAMAAAARDRRR